MKFYITYFYNVRFLSSSTLPVSTAVWDPKWYHKNMSQDFIFKDNRGVYNGFRIEELNPSKIEHISCGEACNQSPQDCDFIKSYHDYIFSLDFNEIYSKLIDLAKGLQVQENFRNVPDICLLVHEKPDNPCSERGVLIDWFKKNNIELEEFQR
jgi:hypothetical protein